MFKKGQKVVKLFVTPGAETASIATIEIVSKGVVHCKGDEHLKYDARTGREIEPAMAFAGISSRLIYLET